MAVYSAQWHRVAALRPRLAPGVQIRRLWLRGQRWLLLVHEGSHRSCRLSPAAYALAGRLDGRCSVRELWEWLNEHAADAPTQDETVDLLVRLRETALVEFDRAADLRPALSANGAAARGGRPPRFNPIAWRMPLGNPTRLLDLIAPWQAWLLPRGALLAWVLLVATLPVLAALHWRALADHAAQWMATPRYLLLALALYPPIKLVHELAHALAVRRAGGAVREIGITLMFGLPVPYVDASAANAFPRKRDRVRVSAAGIAAELALAALALPAWLALDPGWLRDAAFVTLVVGAVSTVLVNANPLQRMDGYYISTDLLELPNLAPRSRNWWTEAIQRRAFGLETEQPVVLAPGERPWLIAYAPLSLAMQGAIGALAVAWLGAASAWLGLAVGLWLAVHWALLPLARLAALLRAAALAQQRPLRAGPFAATLAAGLLLACALPLPRATVAEAVVWPPEQAQLRSGTEGFVQRVWRQDGVAVRAGDLIVELDNPRLRSERERAAARASAIEAELYQALPGEGARHGDLQAQLRAARAELERLDERLAGLRITAGIDGHVALAEGVDLESRYLRQGHLLGHVASGEPATLRAALPEADAADLARRVRSVSVQLADAPGRTRVARWLRDGGGAVRELPSAALGERAGGALSTDPADPQHRRTLQPVLLIDVQLVDVRGDAPERVGTRARVRFDEGHAPWLWQAGRRALQWAGQTLNPQW